MLEVGMVLYTKSFKLTLDRNLCKGCELCKLVCPREAITLIPTPDKDGKAVAHTVDIDENKCDFHGICAAVCPFSAIRISVDGDDKLPAVSAGVFPSLTRDIEVHSWLCEPGCHKCEKACPLGVISIDPEMDDVTIVNVQKDLCAGCQICRMECPADAIEVSKFIEGSITITSEACPRGCRRCLDVCPVDALAVGGRGKVYAKEMFCIYCGACLQVCPSPEALKVERTVIRHTGVESGAWNKGLERITSTEGLMRELSAIRIDKARAAIKSLESSEEKN
jgi:4Fe-4S ferredoxin